MQNDYTNLKVVEQVLQCECCLACLVTMNILDANKAFLMTIKRVGSFFDDYEGKDLMEWTSESACCLQVSNCVTHCRLYLFPPPKVIIPSSPPVWRTPCR